MAYPAVDFTHGGIGQRVHAKNMTGTWPVSSLQYIEDLNVLMVQEEFTSILSERALNAVSDGLHGL